MFNYTTLILTKCLKLVWIAPYLCQYIGYSHDKVAFPCYVFILQAPRWLEGLGTWIYYNGILTLTYSMLKTCIKKLDTFLEVIHLVVTILGDIIHTISYLCWC